MDTEREDRMNRFILMTSAVLCCLSFACATHFTAKAFEGGPATTVPEFYTRLVGDWSGSYSLWLDPRAPAEKSGIKARVRPAARSAYFLLTYSWTWKGKKQEGVFLLGGKDDSASAAWGDSWHMVPEHMQCKGRLEEEGRKMVLDGGYRAGPGSPDWGWRTEFTLLDSGSALMEAYNITPDGQEGLAVRAEMNRVQ